jgi:hypothetical protein
MKKLYILISLSINLLTIVVLGQNNFEVIPFPDSLEITSLAINEQGDLFVSTATGNDINDGIFRSQDNGQSWQCVYDFGVSRNSWSVKINQYGEIYAIANFSIDGGSLIKSIDNGGTWISHDIPEGGGTHNRRLFLTGVDTLFISQSYSNGARLLRSTNDGIDWETLFETTGHTSEFITDLAISENGDMFISLFGYFEICGGVYKSNDNGLTWQFLGLQSHQVTDLEYNSLGDLFISSRGSIDPTGGIYVIYNYQENISPIFISAETSGLVINSGENIFAGNNWQNGIFHSSDGLTFNFITPVMPDNCAISNLYLDSEEYLYATMEGTSVISRSIDPTITSSKNKPIRKLIGIYFDPSTSMLHAFINEIYNKKCYFQIMNSNGMISVQGCMNINSNNLEFQLPDLSIGIYFLRIMSNDFQFSGKFLIN